MSILAVAAGAVWFWMQHPQPNLDLHVQTTIRTEPPGALVVLGDHAQKSPSTFEDLEPRKYSLRIMNPGYEPVESAIDLTAKRPVNPPVFHLVRSKGALEIQSEPPGAQFSIRSEDGQISRNGTTPQSIVALPTGKYLVVAHRGDWEMRGEVEVTRGEIANKVFAFVSATTNITSEPSGAEIFADGKSRGRAPLRLDLPVRSHELTAHIDGWPDEQQKIDIDPQHENAVHLVVATGSVKITSAPGDAAVIANGKELGQTPLVIEEVKPGDVMFELRL